jgi:hypothetical protein
MQWFGENLASYDGQVVDNGQCVRFLQVAAGVPHTSEWRRGAKVRDAAAFMPGVCIATFDPGGAYGNHEDGSSHAAFLLARAPDGLEVSDQWQGQPVHTRLIRYKGGEGLACDDGDAYHFIQTGVATAAEPANLTDDAGVRTIQRALVGTGDLANLDEVDGMWGPKSETALRNLLARDK